MSSKESPIETSSDLQGEDVFMNAVEVAKVASEATKLCENAKYRVELIENLTQKAKEEYESLQDVATGLASTATAVATVALKVCAYSSFQDVFHSDRKYAEKMSFDDFMTTITVGGAKQNDRGNYSFSVTDKGGASGSGTGRSVLQPMPKADLGDHKLSKLGKDKFPIGKSKLKSHSIVEPVAGYTGRRHSVPPELGLLTFPNSNTDKTLDSSHKDYTSEKYPKSVTPSAYKEGLEDTFKSSLTSLTPLWEDRYIGQSKNQSKFVTPANGHGTPVTNDPASWSEKKSLRQFQIKLHQVAPLEGPSNGDLDVIRPDNPTPPETPHFLPSYSNDCSSKNIPVAALAIEEDEFDDAQEALYDSRDAEISSLLGVKWMTAVHDVDGRPSETQKLKTSPNNTRRPVSPLLNRDEQDQYGVYRDENLCQQEKHVFQPKLNKNEK